LEMAKKNTRDPCWERWEIREESCKYCEATLIGEPHWTGARNARMDSDMERLGNVGKCQQLKVN